MKCPFIVNTENEYKKVGEDSYLLMKTRAKYAECVGDECPYYDYQGSCSRVDED